MTVDPADWNFDPQHWADWQRDDNWGPPSLPADAPRTIREPGNAAHVFSRTVRWARTAIRRDSRQEKDPIL